jgi:ferredoxin-NADP reductase
MKVAEPRNHFALVESAPLTVLIGGGIGMTPLIGMAERLDRLGLRFKMYLGTRSRIETPFMDRLTALGDRVEMAFLATTGRSPSRHRIAGRIGAVARAPVLLRSQSHDRGFRDRRRSSRIPHSCRTILACAGKRR